jgi:signal transduction histidine kinase
MTASVTPAAILDTIRQQRIPADAIVAVLDANGTIVARSRRHDEFVGKPGTEDIRELIRRSGEGWGILATRDGQRVYTAYARSGWSDWTVAFGLPEASLVGGAGRSYFVLGIGVLLSIVLAALAALYIGRRISRPIADLRAAAQAIGRGEETRIPPATVAEVSEVAEALRQAAAARWQAERDLQEALVREREARNAAEANNSMKDRFLALLGHELRNPLAAITGAIHVAELSRGADAEQARDIIKRQARHLARLTDDLLDVARMSTGKIVLQKTSLDLCVAVHDCLEALRSAGRLAGHAVSFQGHAALIDADPSRVEQIVANLLVNALKFTAPKGRIDVSVRCEAGDAVLAVRDEGIGMEPELLASAFEPFVQGGAPAQSPSGGLGIGLTLVKHLVELHGGEIRASSGGPGKGSTFEVRLPLAHAQPQGERSPAPRSPAPASRRRVLIIEDNHDARVMLSALLEAHGHEVIEASDGASGIEAVARCSPDIAFVDLGLPGMDGFEVAAALRASGNHALRLAALSGYGSAADKERSRAAGFDLHLTKPLEPATLLEIVEAPGALPGRDAGTAS